jgi:WhiB family redox-sensing transcriptional regulator
MDDFGYGTRRVPVADRFDADATALQHLIANGDDAGAGVAVEDEEAGARVRYLRPADRPAPGATRTLATSARTDGPAGRTSSGLPCQAHDPDLWFAEAPGDVDRAKALCEGCPVRLACLAGALDRREPTGVWGGELLDRGRVVTHKRPRGRPRKGSVAPQSYPAPADEAVRAHAVLRGWLPGTRVTRHPPTHSTMSGTRSTPRT